jgi:hypothetical protein
MIWRLLSPVCVNLARLSQNSASQFKNLVFVVDTSDFECRMRFQI